MTDDSRSVSSNRSFPRRSRRRPQAEQRTYILSLPQLDGQPAEEIEERIHARREHLPSEPPLFDKSLDDDETIQARATARARTTARVRRDLPSTPRWRSLVQQLKTPQLIAVGVGVGLLLQLILFPLFC